MSSTPRSALRVLRAGSVPDEGIGHLTVGADDLMATIRASLTSLGRKGAPKPLFLNGEWGTGKTHSIRLIRKLALQSGFATMEAVLNARTCPPNYPQRMMPFLARDIAFGEDHGMKSVITSLLRDDKKFGIALATAGGKAHADISQAASTLRALASRGETALMRTSSAWRVLTGTDIAHSDYGYRRSKALLRLHWTTAFVRSLGAKGSVLLFDELETIDQLWNRLSRAKAYETFGGFLAAPGTWCVFGITERFLRIVREDARSDLYWRSSSEGRRFLSIWREGEERMIAPPSIGEIEAQKLAATVEAMYRSAYPDTGDCVPDVRSTVVDWSRNAARNPRRLVRAIVDACDRARPIQNIAQAKDAAAI